MEDLFILLFYFGGFSLLLGAGYYLFGIFMYIIYKLDKGKLGFWEYMKRLP